MKFDAAAERKFAEDVRKCSNLYPTDLGTNGASRQQSKIAVARDGVLDDHKTKCGNVAADHLDAIVDAFGSK